MDYEEQMTHNSSDKTLTVPPTKTLSLKRPVEQGVVRPSPSLKVLMQFCNTRIL
jgi:hypothetical protein